MGVGRSPSGEAALMVLATDSPVLARDGRESSRARRAVSPRSTSASLGECTSAGALTLSTELELSTQRFAARRPSASAARVDVAAVGLGAVVVAAAGHVVDAARGFAFTGCVADSSVGAGIGRRFDRAARAPPAGGTTGAPAGRGTAPIPRDVTSGRSRAATPATRRTRSATTSRAPARSCASPILSRCRPDTER